jgi:thiol-disulfide isomerase/thioredoxin
LVALGAILLAVYLTKPGAAASASTPEKAVTQHPLAADFSLTELTGQQLQLSTYRGKVVLLDFWATWCDPCRKEIPQFVQFQSKYGSQGLQIVGIAMDDGPGPVREFYKKFKMNFPVVMAKGNVAGHYGGIFGLPVAFVIGRDGRIYAKYIGAVDVSKIEKEITVLLGGGS